MLKFNVILASRARCCVVASTAALCMALILPTFAVDAKKGEAPKPMDGSSAKAGGKAKEARPTAASKPEPVEKPKHTQESKRPKTRTLEELIDLVMTHGVDKPLKESFTKNLGFPSDVITKAIRYRDRHTPDGKAHAFFVVYETAAGNKVRPTALIWDVSKVIKKEGVKWLDARSMRLSLDGSLEAAFRGIGEAHKVTQTKISVDTTEVKELYAREKQFYLEDSLGLEMSVK